MRHAIVGLSALLALAACSQDSPAPAAATPAAAPASRSLRSTTRSVRGGAPGRRASEAGGGLGLDGHTGYSNASGAGIVL